ncbi:MAG: hypothetical protein KAT90_01825 [Gammaproteobacteria bacterium]|nr:hypothetical protein [Gammaproteobacteria bacterium]
MSDRKRPVGIYIEDCEDVTLENNTGIGDIDLIVAKDSKGIKGHGNKLITPSEKSTWLKPLTVTVIGGLIVAAIAIFILQPWQDKTQSQESEQQDKDEVVIKNL